MRCAFAAQAPAGENMAELLLALALKDGFYVNSSAFEKELRFSPMESGETRIEVYGELAENLLTWAKQNSEIKFRPL